MNNQGAIELLKEMQNPLQDYADMVGAPAFAYGYRYVYPEPEDYAIELAITALENQEKYRWHKVADGDLPQGPYSQKRKFYCKEKGYGYRILLYDDKGFYYYSFDLKIGIDNEQIVAWMELPEYEEDRP